MDLKALMRFVRCVVQIYSVYIFNNILVLDASPVFVQLDSTVVDTLLHALVQARQDRNPTQQGTCTPADLSHVMLWYLSVKSHVYMYCSCIDVTDSCIGLHVVTLIDVYCVRKTNADVFFLN